MINEINEELNRANMENNNGHQFLTFQVNHNKLAVEIMRIRFALTKFCHKEDFAFR